ncbi:hypothetical protein LUZ60_012345 [Juncus effusus]|nr:hypothetical protein LUZ60_012345 [Juncus effusus]
MEGLQRSATTFRRSGSSGLVWDEKFLSEIQNEEGKEDNAPKLTHSRSVGSISMLGKQSMEEAKQQVSDLKELKTKVECKTQKFHSANVLPDQEPDSPKVSGCAICFIFQKPKPKKPIKRPVRR